MPNTAASVDGVREVRETYADGKPRIVWSAGIGNDGRYLLHGKERWYYEDGSKQYEVQYGPRSEDRARDILVARRTQVVGVEPRRQRAQHMAPVVGRRRHEGRVELAEHARGRPGALLGSRRQARVERHVPRRAPARCGARAVASAAPLPKSDPMCRLRGRIRISNDSRGVA